MSYLILNKGYQQKVWNFKIKLMNGSNSRNYFMYHNQLDILNGFLLPDHTGLHDSQSLIDGLLQGPESLLGCILSSCPPWLGWTLGNLQNK